MNVIELVEELIVKGQESLRQNETKSHLIEGGLQGFECCRTIEPTLEAYEAILALRERHLARKREDYTDKSLAAKPADIREEMLNDYWAYVYGTSQIEFVYSILRVAYMKFPLSARAVQTYAAIVGVKK